jgi:aminomethyltransferase
LHPAGIIALDVARIEAGLIMLEVDYTSSKRALIEAQKYSPYELGLGKMVDLKKEYFIGREALAAEHARGPKRLLMGLDVHWEDVERLYDAVGLGPQVQSTASRAHVPVYRGGLQVGKATSTTWSPTLKKMIALASLTREHAAAGTELQMELTVEAVRHKVRATVRELPFFNPPRKTATPVL